MENENELLISGIQHFIFCRRQWALIHVEGQWMENYFTVDGRFRHSNAHDGLAEEKRLNSIIVRGLRVISLEIGITGVCDVVEFHSANEGITLPDEEGKWIILPIEYKRGKSDTGQAAAMQLCAQVLCLEEMFKTKISTAAIYHHLSRKREYVEITPDLRSMVLETVGEMRKLMSSGETPKPEHGKKCKSCSLSDVCLPSLSCCVPVASYMTRQMRDDK